MLNLKYQAKVAWYFSLEMCYNYIKEGYYTIAKYKSILNSVNAISTH